MRVLYFIFVSAGGKGGHFHSLNQISKEIGRINPNIRIISFGRELSPIIENNPYFYKHLYFTRTKFFLFFYLLFKEIKKFNPKVLHFFDAHSYNLFFPISFFVSKEYVVNKCGGPNPISYVVVPNLILFSQENKQWFLSKAEFKETKITVIPNRVIQVKTENLKEYVKNEEYFSLVRICRIGKTYYQSILNGINLVSELTEKKHKVKFYVIGKVTEEREYKHLLSLTKGLNIEFITDDKFTSDASKMLYLADAVIGTGRSAMEACSLGLPTLMPSKQFDYPVLLTNENFSEYFNANFTDRVYLKGYNQKLVFENIVRLIQDKDFYSSTSLFSKERFEKHFDISKTTKLYLNFYKSLKKQNYNIKTVKTNTVHSMSTIYRMFKGDF
jgi:hypothetical protein